MQGYGGAGIRGVQGYGGCSDTGSPIPDSLHPAPINLAVTERDEGSPGLHQDTGRVVRKLSSRIKPEFISFIFYVL